MTKEKLLKENQEKTKIVNSLNDGDKVIFKPPRIIEDKELFEGEISFYNGSVYILNNHLDGRWPIPSKGYKYAWIIKSGDAILFSEFEYIKKIARNRQLLLRFD